MDGLPGRLEKSPLVEVVCELRFDSDMPNAGDVLVGGLYTALSGSYPNIETLPLAAVPRALRDKDAVLRYQASHRLKSVQGDQHLYIGDHAAGFSTQKYLGWPVFVEQVQRLQKALQDTKLVRRFTRVSIRYINVFPSANLSWLDLLNLRIEACGVVPMERGFQLRYEVDGPDGIVSIVQIVPSAEARVADRVQHGLLLDIDSVKDSIVEQANLHADLSSIHDQAKRVFFQLISSKALQVMEPR